ncbi:MAG: P-loop NTPase fold protein, partial [Thermoplasmata archaeon]
MEERVQADWEKVERVRREAEADLLKLPGVTGVHIGYKTVNGKRTDELAIVISVKEKKPVTELPKEDILPRVIQGIPTDVIADEYVPHLRPLVQYNLISENESSICIGSTDAPWAMDVDALVVPFDISGFGSLGPAIIKHLEAIDPSLASDFELAFDEPSVREAVKPDRPRLVSFPFNPDLELPSGFPQVLIAATAHHEGKWSIYNSRKAATAIVRMAADMNLDSIAIPLLGSGVGPLPRAEVAMAIVDGALKALTTSQVPEINIVTLDPKVVAVARETFAKRPGMYGQALNNDDATGEDLLDISTEVHAMADAVMLQDLSPPFVVGILGGWGSGKSFVMHLLRQRMRQIRAMRLKEEETWNDDPEKRSLYVGHVYFVRFDAWTYAKSNLWASLMDRIFSDLNDQLTLEEKQIEGVDAEVKHPTEPLWSHLQRLTRTEREDLEQKVIGLALKQDALVSTETGFLRSAFSEIVSLPKKWSMAKPAESAGFAALSAVSTLLPLVEGSLAYFKIHGLTASILLALLGFARARVNWARRRGRIALTDKDLSDGGRARLANLKSQLPELNPDQLQLVFKRSEAKRRAEKHQADLCELEELETEVESRRQRIGMTAEFASLRELIDARKDENVYEKRLGLMHQVQKDFSDLSRSLVVSKTDPRDEVEEKRKLFP